MYYYVESTLGLSKDRFISLLPSLQKAMELGRGTYGAAYLALLNGIKLVIKESHMNLQSHVINSYITHGTAIKNLATRIMLDEVLNEAQALSELVQRPTTSMYVPPFIGLLVSDSYVLHGGSKIGIKRVESVEELENSNNNAMKGPLMLSIPRGSPGSNNTDNEERDTLFFISKYVHGDTLYNIVNRSPELLIGDMMNRITDDFTHALTAIHAAGWIHCDVHSKNLYIELDDDNKYKGVRILDFGKAVRVGSGAKKQSSYGVWEPKDDMNALHETLNTASNVIENNDESIMSNENEFMPNFNEAASQEYLRALYNSMSSAKRPRLNTNTRRVNMRYMNNRNNNTRKRKIPVRK
jgi:serine/threonine protein kinase